MEPVLSSVRRISHLFFSARRITINNGATEASDMAGCAARACGRTQRELLRYKARQSSLSSDVLGHCEQSAASLTSPVDKNRLEAFSDGVLAIIITIMVLELRVPHGSDWAALEPLLA